MFTTNIMRYAVMTETEEERIRREEEAKKNDVWYDIEEENEKADEYKKNLQNGFYEYLKEEKKTEEEVEEEAKRKDKVINLIIKKIIKM